MSERLNRLTPADLASRNQIIEAVTQYSEERREMDEATQSKVVEFVQELFLPAVDHRGRDGQPWNIKGTDEHQRYKEITDGIGHVPSFVKTAMAIGRQVAKESLEKRDAEISARAGESLRQKSVGDIPNKIGGTDPAALEQGLDHTWRKDDSNLLKAPEDSN